MTESKLYTSEKLLYSTVAACIALVALSFWVKHNIAHMSEPKWLVLAVGSVLLGFLFAFVRVRFTPTRPDICLLRFSFGLAAWNQLLLWYLSDAFFVSRISIFLVLAALFAVLVVRLLMQEWFVRSLGFLFWGSIVWTLLFRMLVWRELLPFNVPNVFGGVIYSFPFGFKTEAAAMVVGLYLMQPTPAVTTTRRVVAFCGLVLAVLLFESRIGLYAAVAIGVLQLLHGRWPQFTSIKRIWLLLAFLPILATWGFAAFGDAPANLRAVLWQGAIYQWFVWLPWEAVVGHAQAVVADQISPYLFHGGKSRFPLILHNDLLVFAKVYWLPLLLACAVLWRKKDVLQQKLEILDTKSVLFVFSLLVFSSVDSLLERPLGLLVVSFYLAGAVLPSLRFSLAQYQKKTNPEKEQQSVQNRFSTYTMSAMLIFCGLLTSIQSLTVFAPDRYCASSYVHSIQSGVSCAGYIQPDSNTFHRLVVWNKAIRPTLPSTAAIEAAELAIKGQETLAKRKIAEAYKAWPAAPYWRK